MLTPPAASNVSEASEGRVRCCFGASGDVLCPWLVIFRFSAPSTSRRVPRQQAAPVLAHVAAGAGVARRDRARGGRAVCVLSGCRSCSTQRRRDTCPGGRRGATA